MRGRLIALSVIGVLALACAGGVWLSTCADPGMCAATVAQVGLASILTGLGIAATLALVAVFARTAWLIRTTNESVSLLSLTPGGPELHSLARKLGLSHVRRVKGATPHAFTVGAFRPLVYCTDSLVERLTGAELEAVLAHESSHARRRDPLRNALRYAAGDVLFLVPLIAWWSKHQAAGAELAADRAAINGTGIAPLARALWITTCEGITMSGANGRLAQLEGTRAPRQFPERGLWLRSGAGVLLAGGMLVCVAPLFGS